MVCRTGREGKCEPAVCDVCTNNVCAFHQHYSPYVVHVQSSTCIKYIWYKCGIFVHADKIGLIF